MTARAAVLQELSRVAAPYGLEVIRTRDSMLPELVLTRSQTDHLPLARLQYIEAKSGPPVLRTLIHDDLSAAEQTEIERHVEERLAPVIRRMFSYALWTSLVDEGSGPVRRVGITRDTTTRRLC